MPCGTVVGLGMAETPVVLLGFAGLHPAQFTRSQPRRRSACARIAEVVYRRGERPIETVLTELCVIYGFCLKPDDYAATLEMSTEDLDAWTNALFEREGLAEPFEKRLWRDVRNHVEHRLSRT
jgi:hypothetical protein